MAGGFGAIHEEDDNWLSGYLATTKYGSDAKLTSNPVRQKKEEKKPVEKKVKKAYKLHAFNTGGADSRRKSMSAVSRPAKSEVAKSVVPKVEVLPDRVNAIREGPAPAGHFVREHRKSKEHPEEAAEGSRKLAKAGARRMSLDYDELDAVKLRVSQAAKVWEQEKVDGEDSEEQRDDVVPASVLARPAAEDPAKGSKGGKGNWLRWPGRSAAAFAS